MSVLPAMRKRKARWIGKSRRSPVAVPSVVIRTASHGGTRPP